MCVSLALLLYIWLGFPREEILFVVQLFIVLGHFKAWLVEYSQVGF